MTRQSSAHSRDGLPSLLSKKTEQWPWGRVTALKSEGQVIKSMTESYQRPLSEKCDTIERNMNNAHWHYLEDKVELIFKNRYETDTA